MEKRFLRIVTDRMITICRLQPTKCLRLGEKSRNAKGASVVIDPKCCAENRGIILNGLGAIVSTDDGIISTSTSTSMSTSTSSATTSSTPTAGITSTLNTAASSPLLATSTPLKSPLPQLGASSTGLTFNAKVGIGIGAAGAVAILAAVTFAVWYRRRRPQNAKARPMTMLYRHELGHSEAVPTSFSKPYTQQLYSHPVEKPAAGSELREMPGQNTPRM